jgi:aryl-alcohol dehydrogenase-like predicted oxidoreductase
MSSATIAAAYVLEAGCDAAVIGASSVHHLEDLVSSCEVFLSPSDLEFLRCSTTVSGGSGQERISLTNIE